MSLVEELAPLITTIARSVAREYPGVDFDDLRQELSLYVLTDGRNIDPQEEKLARFVLNRQAHTIAAKERASGLYSTAQYNYRQKDVRRILEHAFAEHTSWFNAYVPDDAKSIKPSSDPLDVVLDCHRGLEALTDDSRSAIVAAYRDGIVPEASTPERKRLNRAIDKLTEKMNSYYDGRNTPAALMGHEGPGARKAMSNATSNFVIGSGYDESGDRSGSHSPGRGMYS